MTKKQKFLRTVFVAEVFCYVLFYIFGVHGLKFLWALKQENYSLQCDIKQLEKKIDIIEDKIAQWKSHPFYKEKIAREHLQMARSHDKIYYVKE